MFEPLLCKMFFLYLFSWIHKKVKSDDFLSLLFGYECVFSDLWEVSMNDKKEEVWNKCQMWV